MNPILEINYLKYLITAVKPDSSQIPPAFALHLSPINIFVPDN